jgi:hypothetical protein
MPSTCILDCVGAKDSGRKLQVRGTEVSIGRRESCQVQYSDITVSAKHCTLFYEAQSWWLEDLSSNGTYVNNTLVGKGKHVRIADGDTISLLKPMKNMGIEEHCGADYAYVISTLLELESMKDSVEDEGEEEEDEGEEEEEEEEEEEDNVPATEPAKNVATKCRQKVKQKLVAAVIRKPSLGIARPPAVVPAQVTQVPAQQDGNATKVEIRRAAGPIASPRHICSDVDAEKPTATRSTTRPPHQLLHELGSGGGEMIVPAQRGSDGREHATLRFAQAPSDGEHGDAPRSGDEAMSVRARLPGSGPVVIPSSRIDVSVDGTRAYALRQSMQGMDPQALRPQADHSAASIRKNGADAPCGVPRWISEAEIDLAVKEAIREANRQAEMVRLQAVQDARTQALKDQKALIDSAVATVTTKAEAALAEAEQKATLRLLAAVTAVREQAAGDAAALIESKEREAAADRVACLAAAEVETRRQVECAVELALNEQRECHKRALELERRAEEEVRRAEEEERAMCAHKVRLEHEAAVSTAVSTALSAAVSAALAEHAERETQRARLQAKEAEEAQRQAVAEAVANATSLAAKKHEEELQSLLSADGQRANRVAFEAAVASFRLEAEANTLRAVAEAKAEARIELLFAVQDARAEGVAFQATAAAPERGAAIREDAFTDAIAKYSQQRGHDSAMKGTSAARGPKIFVSLPDGMTVSLGKLDLGSAATAVEVAPLVARALLAHAGLHAEGTADSDSGSNEHAGLAAALAPVLETITAVAKGGAGCSSRARLPLMYLPGGPQGVPVALETTTDVTELRKAKAIMADLDALEGKPVQVAPEAVMLQELALTCQRATLLAECFEEKQKETAVADALLAAQSNHTASMAELMMAKHSKKAIASAVLDLQRQLEERSKLDMVRDHEARELRAALRAQREQHEEELRRQVAEAVDKAVATQVATGTNAGPSEATVAEGASYGDPSGLQIVLVETGVGSITLEWVVIKPAAGDGKLKLQPSMYELQWRSEPTDGSGPGSSIWCSTEGSKSLKATSATKNNLSPSCLYRFRVRAKSIDGKWWPFTPPSTAVKPAAAEHSEEDNEEEEEDDNADHDHESSDKLDDEESDSESSGK